MKNRKSLFERNPSENHVARVKSAVEDLLKIKRQAERRKWFAWMLVPAFASVAGISLWKKSTELSDPLIAEQQLLLEIENDSDLDVVADLEILEDLEMLEEWDGIDET